MINLTDNEVMGIKEMVIKHQVIASKLQMYGERSHDIRIKQMLLEFSKESRLSAKKLFELL